MSGTSQVRLSAWRLVLESVIKYDQEDTDNYIKILDIMNKIFKP